MCGRFTQTESIERLAEFFQAIAEDEVREQLKPSYNIAPMTWQAVVLNDPTGGGRQVVPMRWGLVPGWAKDEAIGNKLINARSETVHEKPSFRAAYKARRCLVPASGFYEWQKPEGGKRGGPKQPMYITSAQAEPLAFAGLWEHWGKGARAAEGQPELVGSPDNPLYSFTILTCEPNELMEPIHNRMPVILAQDAWEAWLNPQVGREDLLGLTGPCPPAWLRAYPVDTRVNSPRNNSAENIESLAAPEQSGLFG